MAKFKKLALLGSAALMTMSFAFGVAACDNEHEHASEWSTDADNHWYACKVEDCTETIGKAAHNWDNGVVTANGEKTVTCKVCGYQKKETVATVLTVGEDTTVKVAAGQATEVAVGADSGSYTLSWTNPKTVVKVGDTEYKKADGVAAEDYRGEADLLWIEDGVKVTVATTDGSAADIVISCKKYSAPQLDCYDYDGMMTMITSAQEPSTTAVAAGERGSQFSIYAQNPGWYYVCAIADDGQDDPETPNVVENDYSATITVSANNAYTAPVTVSEGFVAIEVPANSEINVVISHDASAKLDVMAYAMYMVDYDLTIQSGIPFTNALLEYTYSEWANTVDLSVPMASRVYGRIKGVTDPVQVSWNNPSLVFDIAGTVYTKEDCPVTIKRDTFNPTGIYFTAYTKDGSPSTDTITFEKAPVATLENTTYDVVVDSGDWGSTYNYVAPVGGVYSFTVDYDDVKEFSIGAESGGIQIPDTWYKDQAEVTDTVTLTATLAKGAKIGVILVHEEATAQAISFTVSNQPFTASANMTVPTEMNTPATTELEVPTKTPYVVSLSGNGYYQLNIAYAADKANAAGYVYVNVYVDGYYMEYDPYYGTPYKFNVTEGVSPEIVVWATMMDSSYTNVTGTVEVVLELTKVDPPKALTIGTNSWTLEELAYGSSTEGSFTATEAGTYQFTLGDNVTAIIQTADQMTLYINPNNYFNPTRSGTVTLNAGDVLTVTIVNLNQEIPVSFTIEKLA